MSGERSDATTIIEALERLGYVERQSDPTDRRRKYVVLTPEGGSVVREVHDVVDRPPEIFARLTTAQLSALDDIFGLLNAGNDDEGS